MPKKKQKQLEITIPVPDQKIYSHITNAYGLVCKYRQAQKVPNESVENWLLRLVVEGANALYRFHDSQMKQYQEKLEAEAKDSEDNADKIDNSPANKEPEVNENAAEG